MPESDRIQQNAENKKLFSREFDVILSTEKTGYPSFIGGLQVASGMDYQLSSPIDESIIFGKFQRPEEGTAAYAVEAAKKAFEVWSATEPSERAAIFENVLERVKARKFRLAACIAISTGMVMEDCINESNRLIEIIEDACATAERTEPLGVWGIISEHNSSLASPAGAAVYAMLAGNTVVALPAKGCPMPMFMFSDILRAVGVPDGVFNILTSESHKTDMEISEDPIVRGIAVSGGGDRIDELMFLPVDHELRFVSEIKGMNPILVHKTGNMEAVADSIAESAFRSAGQRLYSCSKVIVIESEKRNLLSALKESVKSLVVGDPAELEADVGPLMSKTDLLRFQKLMENHSDMVILGGKRVRGEFLDGGSYVEPAVVEVSYAECELGSYDMGLPILAIVSVSDEDEMFEELLSTECGLSASLFTDDGKLIERFKEEAEATVLNINKGTENTLPASTLSIEKFSA